MIWKTGFTIFSLVLFLAACATTPTSMSASTDSNWLGEFSGVPLPPNIRGTIEPATFLPKELAVFSGIWGARGKFDQKFDIEYVLAVQRITSTGWCQAVFGWYGRAIIKNTYFKTRDCRISESFLVIDFPTATYKFRYDPQRDILDGWIVWRSGHSIVRFYRLYTPPPTSQ